MDKYLVHMTKTKEDLASILASGKIEARNRYGIGRDAPHSRRKHEVVCFTGRKLNDLHRMVNRDRHYGIVFKRDFLIKTFNAQPVWYLDEGLPQLAAIRAFISVVGSQTPGQQTSHPLWDITPFIDTVASHRNWTWEHEWRVVGDVTFDINDVEMLMLKESNSPEFTRLKLDIGGIYMTQEGYEAWGSNLGEEFDNQMETLLDRFSSSFSAPENVPLPWDEGWVEIVDLHDTSDAVEEVFEDYPAEIRWALAQALYEQSSVWCRNTDLQEIEDDAREYYENQQAESSPSP